MPITRIVKVGRRRHPARRARHVIGWVSTASYVLMAIAVGWSQRQTEASRTTTAEPTTSAPFARPSLSLPRMVLDAPATTTTTRSPSTTTGLVDNATEPLHLEVASTTAPATTTAPPTTSAPATTTIPPPTTTPPATTMPPTTTTTVVTTTTIFSDGS